MRHSSTIYQSVTSLAPSSVAPLQWTEVQHKNELLIRKGRNNVDNNLDMEQTSEITMKK